MKRAILNVAVRGREDYVRMQRRLRLSLDSQGEKADRLFWTNRYPQHSPIHQDVPYGFKAYAFFQALMSGYDQALWLDSSCILLEPLDDVWDQIEADGYLLGQEGWTVAQWCSDDALKIMGITRDEASGITLMEGKVIGFDLTSDIAKAFLVQWLAYMNAGAFNGSWKNHRHDISVGAVIAHRLGMRLTPGLITLDRSPALLRASGI